MGGCSSRRPPYAYKLLLVRNWNILLLYTNSPIYLILLPVNSKEAFKSFLGEKIGELLIFSPFKLSLHRSIGNCTVMTVSPPFLLHIIISTIATNSSGIVLEYAGKDLPGFGRTSSHCHESAPAGKHPSRFQTIRKGPQPQQQQQQQHSTYEEGGHQWRNLPRGSLLESIELAVQVGRSTKGLCAHNCNCNCNCKH